ncbi:ribonuclease H-like domain-containing protein [Tanacetum coccineum]
MLELHDATVSIEDANLKFLRSLPSVWHVVATMIRGQPGLDELDFDDLYNNLKVYEHELKGVSNSNSQNIAFLSTDRSQMQFLKQSTAEDKHISQKDILKLSPEQGESKEDLKDYDLSSTVDATGRSKEYIPSVESLIWLQRQQRDEAVLVAQKTGAMSTSKHHKLVNEAICLGHPARSIEERTVREPLELLHMDLFGPVSVESVNRKKFVTYGTEFSNNLRMVIVQEDESRENIALQGLHSKMSEEGYLLGYSTSSKGFRVYNRVTRKVQECLHVDFLENQENQKGKGPDWMFDLDLLTPSMNYIPVRKENYANSGDKVSTLGDVEDLDDQQFIVHTAQPMHPEERTAAKEVPLSSEEQALHDELMNLMHQESLAKAHNDDQRIAFEEEKRRISIAKGKEHVNSTFTLSTANTPPQSAGNTPTDSDDDIPKDGVFSTNSFDDEEGGVADYNNMDSTIDVPSTPTLRIHKIHPQSHKDSSQRLIIKISKHAVCLFPISRGSQKVSQASSDDRWVEAMQEELLQFTLYDVGSYMILSLDLPSLLGLKILKKLSKKSSDEVSMGELTFFLGLSSQAIKWWYLFLSQDTYVKDIPQQGEDVDVHTYRSMIGCLMYLTASRPDIMFAVCLCARFQVTPKVSHLHAVKRIFSPQWKYLVHVLLHCLSPKSTSWEQFGTNIASALVVLESESEVDFSLMIMNGMLGHISNGTPFLMYPRFVQLFLNKQLEGVDRPQDFIPSVSLPSKVFTFMRKHSPKFSCRITPLTPSMLEVVTALAAEEEHSTSPHSRAASSARDAQGTPTQSAAQASISQGTADVQGTDNSQGTASLQGTAASLGTARLQGTAAIPTSPNDYTPTDASQTSGGDEGLLDIYALNREVRRLKKQTLSQAKQIIKLKNKLKRLSKLVQPVVQHHTLWVESKKHKKRSKKHKKHKKKVSSVKLGRNKEEGTLSEEHYVQDDHTADPFFEDIVDKDAAVTPDLERKSDDDFWKNQEDWEIIRWRLNEFSGVHTLELEDGTMIHMLAERRYPLSRELMIRMLDHGMEFDTSVHFVDN